MKKMFLGFCLMLAGLSYQTAKANSASVTVTGTVVDNCTVVAPSIPTKTTVGAILSNPGTTPIAVGLTITCSAYNPNVQLTATNGCFMTAGSSCSAANGNIQYSAGLSATNSADYSPQMTSVQGSQLKTKQTLGTLQNATSAVPMSLNITPTPTAALIPGDYSETFTVTINGQ